MPSHGRALSLVALDVPDVDLVEADERGKQADVGLSQLVFRKVALAGVLRPLTRRPHTDAHTHTRPYLFVALEVSDIDLIKPDERNKQADIGLSELVSRKIALAGEDAL